MEDINTKALSKTGNLSKIEALLQKRPIILQLLRFGAIGVINTALDFLVLNFISKTLGISSGYKLGGINVAGFILAVIQSYYWNRAWTFAQQQAVSVFKNFWRLVAIGGLGAGAVIFVLVGARLGAPASLYLVGLFLFLVVEVLLWEVFGLTKALGSGQAQQQFALFIVVSLIGLVINSALVALLSQYLPLVSNPDLNKNFAKILATLVSLVWNFIGYKMIVFKK